MTDEVKEKSRELLKKLKKKDPNSVAIGDEIEVKLIPKEEKEKDEQTKENK